jgi:hypothetical protein
MENIQIIEGIDGVDMVIIDRGNNEFTTMTKEHWDKLEAEREQSGTL